eukprot:UN21359
MERRRTFHKFQNAHNHQRNFTFSSNLPIVYFEGFCEVIDFIGRILCVRYLPVSLAMAINASTPICIKFNLKNVVSHTEGGNQRILLEKINYAIHEANFSIEKLVVKT